MDNKKIGEFISTLRKNRNLTQKDLADILGITDKAVSKWERGVGYPDISILHPLADALGTSVNELLEGEISEVASDTTSKNIDIALDYADNIIATKENRIGKILAVILSICLFIAMFTCVIVNVAIDSTLSWSILAIAGCMMAGCLIIPPLLKKKKGIYISILLLTLFIIPFLVVIEAETYNMTGYGGWLWKLGLPITLIWLVFLWTMVILTKRKITLWFFIFIAAFLWIPCNFLSNYTVDRFLKLNPFDTSRQFSNILTIACSLFIAFICFVVGLYRKNKYMS